MLPSAAFRPLRSGFQPPGRLESRPVAKCECSADGQPPLARRVGRLPSRPGAALRPEPVMLRLDELSGLTPAKSVSTSSQLAGRAAFDRAVGRLPPQADPARNARRRRSRAVLCRPASTWADRRGFAGRNALLALAATFSAVAPVAATVEAGALEIRSPSGEPNPGERIDSRDGDTERSVRLRRR